MPTPSIQTLRADAQQVLNLDSISAVRSVVAATLANANAGTPLNPNLTTQQLWNEFYQIVTQPKSDIESIIANQLMKFLYAPPAPGGAGADKQVIFNDGGVLAGDPQFLWNKTTNLLTVTGSATITGALAANADTTLGTASKSTNTNLNLSSDLGTQRIYLDRGTRSLVFQDVTSSIENYRIAGITGVHTWGVGGSTAMTLNATGLGVGGPPAAGMLLTVGGTSSVSATANALQVLSSKGTFNVVTDGSTNAAGTTITYSWANGGQGPLIFRNAAISNVMTLDASGNVGIGVTPSAWGSNKAIEGGVSGGKTGSLMFGSDGSNWLINNAIVAASTTYKATAAASYYYQNNGLHIWSNAPSGTAGNTITWTQAMTLDASGNLSLANGNLVMGTSGKGIDFSATAEGGAMTSELLNDYEEGEWTGTLKGSTSDPTTPVTATGKYTKIGRQVTVQISFISVNTTGASSRILVSGLPFAASSSPNGVTGSVLIDLAATFTGSPAIYLGPSATQLDLYSSVSNGAVATVTHNAGTARSLWLNVTYTV